MIGTFGVDWADAVSPDVSPATDTEIADAMCKIRAEAKKPSCDGVVTITARREVAKAIREGINGYERQTTRATVDVGSDPWYDKELGYYMSELVVARDKTRLYAHIDTY